MVLSLRGSCVESGVVEAHISNSSAHPTPILPEQLLSTPAIPTSPIPMAAKQAPPTLVLPLEPPPPASHQPVIPGTNLHLTGHHQHQPWDPGVNFDQQRHCHNHPHESIQIRLLWDSGLDFYPTKPAATANLVTATNLRGSHQSRGHHQPRRSLKTRVRSIGYRHSGERINLRKESAGEASCCHEFWTESNNDVRGREERMQRTRQDTGRKADAGVVSANQSARTDERTRFVFKIQSKKRMEAAARIRVSVPNLDRSNRTAGLTGLFKEKPNRWVTG